MLLVFIVGIVVAINFSAFLTSSHHWVVGVLGIPLGFCSAMYFYCMMGEVSVRLGYSRMGRTPTPLIQRSLVIGSIVGAVIGVVFYCLGVVGFIPTVVHAAHRVFFSACLFGLSVDCSVAFFYLLTQGSRANKSENPTTDLSNLKRRCWRIELLTLTFAVLAFAWVPAGLILIVRDADSRPVFTVFRQLWPLLVFPLCCAGVCWFWRVSLKRQIKERESAHDS